MLRPDIQALRGLAVLVVLLFHARLTFAFVRGMAIMISSACIVS